MAMLNAIALHMFQNKVKIIPTVLPRSLADNLQHFKKMSFICNDKRISDNNTNSEAVIGRCDMNCAKKHLIDRSKHYEAPYRFNIL